MDRQERLEEIMAELLIKQDEIIDELKGMNKRFDKVEKEVHKLNLNTSENSSALIKVADLLEGEVMARINRLEDNVYKK